MHILSLTRAIGTVALVCTCVYFSPSSLAREPNEAERKEIAALGSELLRTFDTPNTIFVGVGQSPSSLMAYLETKIDRQRTVLLPLSSASGLPVLKTLFPLDTQMGRFMASYLRQFLPLGDLTYVFVDFTFDGDGFAAQRELIEAGLKELGLDASRHAMVALLGPNGRKNGALVSANADKALLISAKLEDAFLVRAFRDIHPYTKRHLFDVMREYFALGDERARSCLMRGLADDWSDHFCAERRARLQQRFLETKSSCFRWLELWRFER